MATFASRISDLTNAIATAINARAPKVGASAYDIAVINGYTGTQAQWLTMQQGGMTSAQRTALTGSDLWNGRLVAETDTGITWRYNGTAWKAWNSAWATASITWSLPGSTIYISQASYRYSGGMVLFRGQASLTAGPLTFGDNYVTLPVTESSPYQLSQSGVARVVYTNASEGFQYEGIGELDPASQRLYFKSMGNLNDAAHPGKHSQIGGTTPFNEAWAQSDAIMFYAEYDPA